MFLTVVVVSPEMRMRTRDEHALVDLLRFASANSARFVIESFTLEHGSLPSGLIARLERRYGPEFLG